MENQKKVMLFGTQPSDEPYPGNYLGAIKNWGARADEFDCFYFMTDMYTITVCQTPAELRRHTLEQVAQYTACGLDPGRNTTFVQSHVHQHVEPVWVLKCYAISGKLSRMTQSKGKSAKHADSVNAGLPTYLYLMATDILLYQPDFIPVGEDQKQCVELTRSVAQHFNHVYGDVLKVPEPYIPRMGMQMISLNQPDTKMSKFILKGRVFLMDKPENILRKFKRTITDSNTERCIHSDRKNKPGVSNLMSIYSTVTGRSFEAIEAEFDGKGCGTFRSVVDETVVRMSQPIQEETRRLLSDRAYLESVYRAGAKKASYVTEKIPRKIYKKMGFLAR